MSLRPTFSRTTLIVALALAGLSGCSASFQASVGGAKEPESPEPKESKSKKSDSKDEDNKSTDSSKKDDAEKAAKAAKEAEKQAAAQVKLKGDTLLTAGALTFEPNGALSATDANATLLDQVKAYLALHPKVTMIRIEGRSSGGADDDANLTHSGGKAVAVKNDLVNRGVAAERLVAVGFGANGEDGVQFKLATLKGKKYRGKDPLGGGTEFK